MEMYTVFVVVFLPTVRNAKSTAQVNTTAKHSTQTNKQ